MRHTLIFWPLALAVLLAGCPRGPDAAVQQGRRSAPSSSAQPSEPRTAGAGPLDQLLWDVHADILAIRKEHRWLVGYSDASLYLDSEAFRIEFYPEQWDAEGDAQAQQPDHLFVRIDQLGNRPLKYNNALEQVDACAFAGFGLRVYGDITARGSNSYLKDRLVRLIAHRCEEAQRRLGRTAP